MNSLQRAPKLPPARSLASEPVATCPPRGRGLLIRAFALCVPLYVSLALGQEANLVENGDFELRTPDGWVEGWERLLLTADCQVEAAPAEHGGVAVKVAGGTKKSKGGLRSTLRPFEGPPMLRVSLMYRGTKGRRYILIRADGSEEGEEPSEHRIPLTPSERWRPAGETVTLGEPGDAMEPGDEMAGVPEAKRYVIELYHEGPGETWFDRVAVAPGAPAPRPAQPAAAPVGPYATSYSPGDGAVVAVNPPRLRWPGRPGATYAVQWSTSPDFPPESTHRAESLELNLYIPPEPLAPGTWYWRVTETIGPGPGLILPGPFGGEEDEREEGEEEIDLFEGEEEQDIEGLGEDVEPGDEMEPPAEDEPPKPRRKQRRRPAPESPDASARVSSFALILPLLPVTQDELDEEEPPEDEEETGESAETETLPEDVDDLDEPPVMPPGIDLKLPSDERLHAPEPHESVSATRTFRVDESSAIVLVPPVEAIVASLASHPRVWLTADNVVGLRALSQGPLKAEWDRLKAGLDEAKGDELPEEPTGRGKWRRPSPKQLEANEEILRVAATEAGLVRDFAFAAALTGEESYADEAKRRALHLAAWDAKGSTGYESHDQAFREILLALSLAIDWLSQSLSDEETSKLGEAVTARGEVLHKALSEGPRPLNLFPYSSHGQTAVGFLTVAGLAAAGDVPQAEEWLQFALPTAVTLFSPWAGDDGGWMQGETYWKRSAPYTFQLFDALRTAADINLYALPWAKNTSRYKAHMHPPYSPRGGFGDGPEVPPDAGDRLAALRLASALKDPVAAWYAASVEAPEPEPTAFDLLWHDPDVAPKAPDDLPLSAAFSDSGLFAMHSSLTDPRGIHLYGRASSFGSFNHAHADQNHFRLSAFGQPLLIDAGYHDWYRSPHGTSFSRTSLAHNTLLVNGKVGQRTDDITAGGKIEDFLASEHFDYASTEAEDAYPRAILKTFRRHFIFCRPDCVVVWDHVEAGQKASFTWLLHSLEEPTLDAETSVGVIRQGEAGLTLGAFGPAGLVWKTNSRFPQNPRFTEQDVESPPQWHTTVSTKARSEVEDLLLVLAPFEGEAAPEVKAVEAEGGKGAEAKIGGTRVVTAIRVGEAESVSCAGFAATADCIVLRMAGGDLAAVFALALKSLQREEATLITATAPCLVTGTLGEKPALTIEPSEQATITIACPTQPAKLLIDGEEQAAQWADGTLTVELSAERHELAIE